MNSGLFAVSAGPGHPSEGLAIKGTWAAAENGKILMRNSRCGALEAVAGKPLELYTRFGEIAICFSGSVRNKASQVDRFIVNGHTFSVTSDGKILIRELIGAMIASNTTILEGLWSVLRDADGDYSVLVLSAKEEKIYAARLGEARLFKGRKGAEFILSSDAGVIEEMDFTVDGSLASGDIVWLKAGKFIATERPFRRNRPVSMRSMTVA